MSPGQAVQDGEGEGRPCIDPIFGPTASSFHWSASTRAGFPNFAWNAAFNGGGVGNNTKVADFFVRAVRAGSCN